MEWLRLIGWAVFGIYSLLGAVFFLTSLLEHEKRAALVTALVFVPFLASYYFVISLEGTIGFWLLLAITLLITVPALLFVSIKTKSRSLRIVSEQNGVDERDAVFHRFRRLEPDTPEFDAYYAVHPEKREFDDAVRRLPHMDEPGSKTYDSLTSAFMNSLFTVTEDISRDLEWKPRPVEGKPIEASPKEFAHRIKGFAKYLGACHVGCTALNPAYVYTNIGRAPGEWGAPIELNHKNAIAIAVPMDHEMARHSPDSPTSTETGFRYLECGVIAMVIARYINVLGYEARAHVDANYRVMCVPIAADAGIGELGRLGLLISPKYGPRLRLSVVTTNMELEYDKPISFGVQDFCNFCKKCADICPSGSVDKGEKSVYAGAEKWQTKQDTCYRYWRMVGSDCCLCVKVCPYSHQSNFVHDTVRWLITRNHLIRRAALFGDDLAYGRKPSADYPVPDWHEKEK